MGLFARPRRELGFEPRPMVQWLDPRQLAQTAVQVVVSAFFGAYADKRELQAALTAQPIVFDGPEGYGDTDELWLDFVADLGDGWRPTCTIAWLLAQESLAVGGETLPRGRILVMGGDQVYPTASRDEYENRMIGPYRGALPWAPPERGPHLFAIPGNHDWYDGLTNFIRLFCQGGWIGAWRTRQQRSYFAVELPHRWWLWGIDIQFDVYIDKPQLDYFQAAAERLREGDKILLVTGKPSWKHGTEGQNLSYANLTFLEEKVIEPSGAKLVVTLTGDDHHYARYEEETAVERKRQKITAGGGGAFLNATHHLRDELPLGRRDLTTVRYRLAEQYPAKWLSRHVLPWWALYRIWRRNPTFVVAVALAYVVPAILLHVPVRRAGAGGFGALFEHAFVTGTRWQWLAYAGGVLLVVLVLFAAARSLPRRAALGLVHTVPHLGLLAAFVVLMTLWLPAGWPERSAPLVAVTAASLAALPGTVVVALYLRICDYFFGERLSRHVTELYACQAIEDYKNFLRLRVARDGLTIWALAVDPAARSREIRPRPHPSERDPTYEIPGVLARVKLIDGPIRVA